MKISVVIPAFNESDNIIPTLKCLQTLRSKGHEVILADGHSTDNTIVLAEPLVDKIIHSAKGRAVQMNNAASHAQGEILWFIHADTIVPDNAHQLILNKIDNNHWGRFDVRLSGQHFLFRIIEHLMNFRSRVSGIATGDQGIFIRKHIFQKLNGYADIPLMEDIEMSKRLKQISRPACISEKLITSSRRWEKHGIIKTILLMWRLRLAYFLGVSPSKLVTKYY